jgi:hypothetical protein
MAVIEAVMAASTIVDACEKAVLCQRDFLVTMNMLMLRCKVCTANGESPERIAYMLPKWYRENPNSALSVGPPTPVLWQSVNWAARKCAYLSQPCINALRSQNGYTVEQIESAWEAGGKRARAQASAVSTGHANASEKGKANRERLALEQGFGDASEKYKADVDRVALEQGFGNASAKKKADGERVAQEQGFCSVYEKSAADRERRAVLLGTRSSEALREMDADYARFLKADLDVDEQKLTEMQKRLLWRMKRYKAAGHHSMRRLQVNREAIRKLVLEQMKRLMEWIDEVKESGRKVIVCKGTPGAVNDLLTEVLTNVYKTFTVDGNASTEFTDASRGRLEAAVEANKQGRTKDNWFHSTNSLNDLVESDELKFVFFDKSELGKCTRA